MVEDLGCEHTYERNLMVEQESCIAFVFEGSRSAKCRKSRQQMHESGTFWLVVS